MKDQLIAFSIIVIGSFAMHYFLFARDNSIGEMLFISAVPAAIIALIIQLPKAVGSLYS